MLRRLQRMSVAEILHRAMRTGRHVVERRLPSLGRPPAPGHEALAERRWFLDLADRESIRRTAMERLGWSEATARDLRAHRFSFFALEKQDFGAVIRWNRDYRNGVDAPGGFGPLLDYRDSARFGDIKYLWEHNRHHHFVELAKAWYLTGDEEYASDVVAQLVSWLEECPYPRGVQWSSALESALRVINWVFALRFLRAGARQPVSLTDDILRRWLHVLHQHLWFIDRNLSRHSSANNHLIGEAAGLFIGALMVETPHSSRWLRRAKEILEREALAQVWADGVTKEQTTAYQTFVFDFLYIAARLGELNGIPFSRTYLQRLERMAEFVRALLDGNGEVPGIGDDDEGHVVVLCHAPGFRKFRSLVTTASLTFGRPDLAPEGGGGDEKTFWLTGRLADDAEPVPTAASGPRRSVPDDFPDGGYFILRGADARVVFDCGPLGYLSIAAHGHADALSVLLDHRGVPILVDPGTYVYHTDRTWRDFFRGTRAHSTVTVDALDQSVIGGSFLWLRHARAQLLHRSTGRVRGRHDGYTRLPNPVVHEREVRLDADSRTVVVTDLLQCSGEHSVEILWQLHPDCLCSPAGRAVRIERGPAAIMLEPDGDWGTVSLHAGESDPPLGWYSPGIDRKTAATAVRVAGKIRGTTTCRTTIHLL
jgi:hypothetical protein